MSYQSGLVVQQSHHTKLYETPKYSMLFLASRPPYMLFPLLSTHPIFILKVVCLSYLKKSFFYPFLDYSFIRIKCAW